MALQGTLDTFELPDVLRLLSSTRKSGRLYLQGDRGEGSVWLADGKVVGVASPGAAGDDATDGLFDLLRAHEGSFAFEPGVAAPHGDKPVSVEPMLAAAEQRLAEWREIEAVVPSMHAWVSLASELPAPELTVDADTWRIVATIGSGLTVTDLGRTLGLPEVPVCRVVRDLVVIGLGVVTDAPASATTWASSTAAAYEPRVGPTPVDVAPAVAEAPAFADDDSAGYRFEAAAETYASPAPVPQHDLGTFGGAELADDEADEVARQLAMLSPRAAQAVAAAAAADSDDARDAALEALDESDEPINRGLLLKFLSSVKS